MVQSSRGPKNGKLYDMIEVSALWYWYYNPSLQVSQDTVSLFPFR